MAHDETEKLGLLIHDAARLIRRRFEAKTSGSGLSAAQWRLLVRVVKEPGIAQARLAELLEIEPISVSRLIDRMGDGGWIERRSDTGDRRVRLIFPTAKAEEAFEKIKSVSAVVYEDALAGMSAEARRALIEGLRTINRNLADGEASACAEGGNKAA